jgi:prolyl 4-hydroxylase
MDFIRQTFLEDVTICDKLIKLFDESSDKHPGAIISGGKVKTDPKRKKSTDMTLREDVLETNTLREYLRQLSAAIQEYANEFPFCDSYSPWGVIEPPVLKKYEPGEAFFAFHTERMSAEYPNSARHLVFMTYLNTVSDQGETEWTHQKLKVSPEKGKTVIWPADWTHTHRGLPSPTEEKYIISGWLSYMGPS